jgi:hypothetical protein
LILISLPGHVIFLLAISKIKAGHVPLSLDFVIFYLAAAFLQVNNFRTILLEIKFFYRSCFKDFNFIIHLLLVCAFCLETQYES